MPKLVIILSFIFLLFSCGKSADEKVDAAVLTANLALGTGDCQTAIDVLEANGRANTHALYLKTLSSAYACRAGYSTVNLFASDISKTATPAPLGGLTTYSTSSATVATTLQNDEDFKDLQKAIDILLYAGGIGSTTEPTSAERKKHFSSSVVGDMDSQLLYMVLVQLGRYMYYYGDSSATGVKGSGAGTNTCFTHYSAADADIKFIIQNVASTNSCKVLTSSNTELADTVTAATRKTKLCQGVILLNGVFTLLPAVISSIYTNPADQAVALASVAVLSLAKTALIAADASTQTVANTMNQTICEGPTDVTVSNIESYFGLMFENVFL